MPPTLTWRPELEPGLPPLNTLARRFVELLAAVEVATDADVLAPWQTLVAHADAQFGAEEQAMQASHFAHAQAHTREHRQLLEALHYGADCAAVGDVAPLRQMTRELCHWLPEHSASRDAALARHLRHAGFDSAWRPPRSSAGGPQTAA